MFTFSPWIGFSYVTVHFTEIRSLTLIYLKILNLASFLFVYCTQSIVLSGGYEDEVDSGVPFLYTGSGGRNLSGNKRTAVQSSNQTLDRTNKAIVWSCMVQPVSDQGGDAGERWKEGKPVYVVHAHFASIFLFLFYS